MREPIRDNAVGLLVHKLAELLESRGIPRDLLELSPEGVIEEALGHSNPTTAILAEAYEVAYRTREICVRRRYKDVFRGKGEEVVNALDALAALRQVEPSYGFAKDRPGRDPFAERKAALAAFYDDDSVRKAQAHIAEARASLHLAASALQRHALERKELEYALFKKPWLLDQLRQARRLQRAWQRWIRYRGKATHVVPPWCLRQWLKVRVRQPAHVSALTALTCDKRPTQKVRLIRPQQKLGLLRLRRTRRAPLRSRRWVAQVSKSGLKHWATISSSKWALLAYHAAATCTSVQALEALADRATKPRPSAPDCLSEWKELCYGLGAKLERSGMSRDEVVDLLIAPGESLRSAQNRIGPALNRYLQKST